jgi:hypothetical protein
LRTFKVGDYVDIKVNGAVHKGMPHFYRIVSFSSALEPPSTIEALKLSVELHTFLKGIVEFFS